VGDGWLAVGNAAVALDPVFSTGLLFALRGGELAADAVSEALRAGDVSTPRLSRWHAEFFGGITVVQRLIAAFYAECFSLEDFVQARPQHALGLTDLLAGKVFGRDHAALLGDLERWRKDEG
jgi:flavin-dependent dehydrogenase